MAVAARKAALKLPGWSDIERKKGIKGEAILKLDGQQIVRALLATEVATLVSKSKEGCLDLSSPQFQLESSVFLREVPDSIKTLVLSDGALTEIGAGKSVMHLSKLKRLELNNNSISTALLRGMKSLEALSLASNRLDAVPDFTDQEELEYLDLSGNRITSAFSELGKLKNLRVLDLGDCGIDLPENEFFNFVLPHLKKLSKLEYINFYGNPIQTTIREFRYFIIQELPRLKYLNWELIAKEDRSFAADLAASGTWDNKTKSVALHATNSQSHIPRPTATPRDGDDLRIKTGTYATSRLEELLAAEEAKVASEPRGGASSSGSKDLEDLDQILNMVSGLQPGGSAAAAKPISASSSTSSVLDEIEALLGPAKPKSPSAAPAAPQVASSSLSQVGNRGSYVDTLNGVLDDVLLGSAAPKGTTPSRSASGSSVSSVSAEKPAVASKVPADPLDELDMLLSEVSMPISAPTTKSTNMKQSGSGLALAHSGSNSSLPRDTPPPPSRGNSLAVIDPLDDILGQLEAETATTKKKDPDSPSPAKSARSHGHTKPRSTIFEDLESDMFEVVSDHSARMSTNLTGVQFADGFPSPHVARSPHSAPNTARLSTAVNAMSNNSVLDLLEKDILAMTQPGASSSNSGATGGANGNPSLRDGIGAAPKLSSSGNLRSASSPQIIQAPAPVNRGGGLAALANFTSAITTNQFDSLLDSFESASAAALNQSAGSLGGGVPASGVVIANPGSSTTPPATGISSPSPQPRSMQRGPRPSQVTPMMPTKTNLVNAWEIPAEDLTFDFLLGRGVWGETFEGGWRYERDSEGGSKSMPVTLKRLHNKDYTPESVAHLRNEVKELLTLKHDHLVPLIGCSVRDAKVLLWKSIHGAPLWGYLRNPSNVVTPKEVLVWARQLASVLVYLHSQNVIHGGVKPQNIIIDKEQRVMLKDYAFMDYKDEISLLDSDPRWLAPELINGRTGGYNEKIDVYAFGMVIYDMMMREAPFITLKPSEIIDMHTHRVIHPETVPGIFPPVFIRLLNACWAHDPADRPSMEKVLKILESNPSNILGDYADMQLQLPTAKVVGGGRPAGYNAMAPRPSEPPKPMNLPDLSTPPGSPASQKAVPKIVPRSASVSVGTMHDSPNAVPAVPAAPSRPSLRVVKPQAIKPLISEELTLELEQERKLVALLSKLQEMLSGGDPEAQTRALTTLVDVVKDERRINYVANRSLITRDLVELLRANSIDTITSWRYDFPQAFETIELILKTVATLSATDAMGLAFIKHGMMEVLVEFVTRAVDPLKILAAQAIYEICLTSEGRTACRKAAGLTSLLMMIRTKNDFVQAQAALTLSSVLDDEINQEDFVTAGGLEIMGELLKSTNAALKLRALDALSNFWSVEAARPLLVQGGIKDKFIQMLTSSAQMLQSTALRGIGKFSRYASFQPSEMESLKILKVAMEVFQGSGNMLRDRLNAIQICDQLTKDKNMLTNFRDMGGMSMMVKCINDSHPDVRCAAIQVISRALSDDKSRDAIVALGAVAPLVAQLASSDTRVRIRAMAAVDVLRKFPRGKTSIVANAAVSRIVSIVAFSEDHQEQVLALQLLDCFSDNPDHREEVREAGGLTAILQALPSYSPEGKLWACTNLGHLCSTEKNRQALIEQKGVGPFIVTVQGMYRVAEHSFSQRSPGEEFIPEPSLAVVINTLLNTLHNMAEVAEFRTALRDADAAQFTCDMFASNLEEIQIHAVRALTALATDPKNKVVIRTGAAKRLKQFALNSGNPFLAQSSNQVLVLTDAK
jgi:serine/threonine protein kinase